MLGQPQFAIMSLHYLTRNIQSETGAARTGDVCSPRR